MSAITNMLANLTNMGFYDFILPWLLFLAVFYGLLQGKKTISEDSSVNGVIAIVSAFLVAYIARGMLYTRIFGTMGVVFAGFLMIVIFLALFGIKPEELLGSNKTALAIILGIIGLAIFLSAGGLDVFGTSIDSETSTMVVVLILMFGAIAFIGGGGKKD